jgi:hypothetical protein
MGYCCKHQGAFLWLRKALELEYSTFLSPDRRNNYGVIFIREGMQGFWRTLVDDFGHRIPPYQRAALYAELRDVNRAFECLKEATQVPLETPLPADPRFDEIRKDARYVKLLRELGW